MSVWRRRREGQAYLVKFWRKFVDAIDDVLAAPFHNRAFFGGDHPAFHPVTTVRFEGAVPVPDFVPPPPPPRLSSPVVLIDRYLHTCDCKRKGNERLMGGWVGGWVYLLIARMMAFSLGGVFPVQYFLFPSSSWEAVEDARDATEEGRPPPPR